MSSNQTPAYGLNQWSLEDQVIMSEFNADNAKIEQALLELKTALPQLTTGSYIGTGTCGESSPNTLTFDFVPKLVIVTATERGMSGSANNTPLLVCIHGSSVTMFPTGNTTGGNYYALKMHLTWSGNTLSWYTDSTNVDQQLNREGALYHYFAIG